MAQTPSKTIHLTIAQSETSTVNPSKMSATIKIPITSTSFGVLATHEINFNAPGTQATVDALAEACAATIKDWVKNNFPFSVGPVSPE